MTNEFDKLHEQINLTRKHLYELTKNKLLTDPEVVQKSQELDKLLNKLLEENNKSKNDPGEN